VLAPFAIRSFGICDGAMVMGLWSGAVTTSGAGYALLIAARCRTFRVGAPQEAASTITPSYGLVTTTGNRQMILRAWGGGESALIL
jgi:hypothetical protein